MTEWETVKQWGRQSGFLHSTQPYFPTFFSCVPLIATLAQHMWHLILFPKVYWQTELTYMCLICLDMVDFTIWHTPCLTLPKPKVWWPISLFKKAWIAWMHPSLYKISWIATYRLGTCWSLIFVCFVFNFWVCKIHHY